MKEEEEDAAIAEDALDFDKAIAEDALDLDTAIAFEVESLTMTIESSNDSPKASKFMSGIS